MTDNGLHPSYAHYLTQHRLVHSEFLFDLWRTAWTAGRNHATTHAETTPPDHPPTNKGA